MLSGGLEKQSPIGSVLAPGKVEVRLPPDAFDNVGDLFLEIDFEGDVGSAFLDGRLVADRFNNGTPWVIGLKRFAPRILESGLVLCVSPTREGGDTRVEFTNMAAMQAKAGQGKAEIRRIGIVPEYRTDILAAAF